MSVRIAKRPPNRALIWRWVAVVVVAVVLFALGISHQAYDVTSPGWWTLHQLARKIYGLGAFALLGYLFKSAAFAGERPNATLLTAIAVAAYSAALEVGQHFAGSHEGHASNAIDVLAGFIGGALGALLAAGRSRLASGQLPVEGPAERFRDESSA